MVDSRTKNTKRNMISGLVQQIINIVLPFFTRTLILYKLGEQYQGLNGLFTSILQVLNLTDLGFTSAVVYILYKPVAEQDNQTVCAIMAYFKKVYRIIGFVVLTIGLVLLPFLPYLIKGSYPKDINIYLLYIIYLANSVISYWLFAYKSALLNAMQRADIVNNISAVTRIVMYVSQVIVLFLCKNYYIYIIFLPVTTVINNILLEILSKKYFPEIFPEGIIQDNVKKELVKQVKGIFINRIGDVARNGADNIFLSALIGLNAVAVYNNYFYVYTAVYGVSLAIANSMGASVGNSIAKESIEKNYNDFCKFTFIFSWFTGWCTVCLCCLYQPFMMIWMRGDTNLLLPDLDMFLFCAYFYAITMNNIRNQYLNGAGLYWELRLWYILEAVGNILFNCILGYFFGITGIILATLVTIVIFNFISRNYVLFNSYFRCSIKEFYIQHIFYIITTVLGCVITYSVCLLISLSGISGLMIKAVICIFIPNLLFFIAYFKTDRFQQAVSFVKRNILHRS